MTSRPVRLGLLIASLALLVACDHYSAAEGEPAPSLAPGPSPFVAAQRDPCFTPDPPSPITVSVVHRADGTCWPISKELFYRCDPSMPAVAEVDVGQGVRRFLGGSYAVPVALPATALSEGVTPFGELFLDPGDPSFLWVRSDGVTERWLALPNRAKLADPPTAQMIGDSILDGGQTDVAAGLPDWTVSIDALIGRGSSGAAGVAEALPSPAADVVVIEIGVNDPEAALTTANAQRVITAQGGARLLVWLTAHGPESRRSRRSTKRSGTRWDRCPTAPCSIGIAWCPSTHCPATASTPTSGSRVLWLRSSIPISRGGSTRSRAEARPRARAPSAAMPERRRR